MIKKKFIELTLNKQNKIISEIKQKNKNGQPS